VNNALPDEYEEFNDLENAINALVTEYQEALEELED
jgi:HAMP domain-containing protein